ncbi:MAG TPA: GNAT family N-acetyltransferase [Rhodanobacteraceae bacterium]|jgi:predicted GNAT family N-acyltransferase|nr:GNAT family N-acetyltransferase [Rhodanobacteraceae bacterium]
MIREGFRVEPADWITDLDALRTIRDQVFVVEQSVPVEDEWDAFDARSRHVIARDAEDRPIGTGRLTPDRLIGRMGVLSEWRGRGVGEALLKALLDQARALGYPSVELHAQVHAISFYTKYGFEAYGDEFVECEIRHRMMRLDLSAPAKRPAAVLPPRPEARVLIAEDRDQAVAAIADLLADTAHEIAIYTRDLDPALLDVPAILDAIKRIALSGRRARVRILIHEPRKPLAEGHRLIALAQRLPSLIEFRTPEDEHDRQYASAFLINDRRGYLFRILASRNEGEGSSYAPGRHAQLREYFDQVWERSVPSEELRHIAL